MLCFHKEGLKIESRVRMHENKTEFIKETVP